MKLFEELKWRGLLNDYTPEVENHIIEQARVVYAGIDPTADSLHIGHLVSVIVLRLFQKHGHKPLALIGGATGMVGDPSGKSSERNLIDLDLLKNNELGIKKQLEKLLKFSDIDNNAELVNNYNWTNKLTFIEFIRDIGKHITVNYMMAKESVKKRISNENSEGMSFTEFTYQLIQGNDFYHLYQNNNCTIQVGGSDQWGNMVTGTELIRRKIQGKAYCITFPLITKSDGNKFGKSESGNIWLDPSKTSPYKFYQFLVNISDDDAQKYVKIFTDITFDEYEEMRNNHEIEPHKRLFQNYIAENLTILVHSFDELNKAKAASKILFSNDNDLSKTVESLDINTLNDVFESLPFSQISHNELNQGIDIMYLLTDKTKFLQSKSEAKRQLNQNSISINKTKINEGYLIDNKDLLLNKFILLRKGKKDYFLIIVE